MQKHFIIILTVLMAMAFSAPVWASCTKDDVVAQVNQTAGILESQGTAHFEEIPSVRFCGDNYVYIMDIDATILAHGFMDHLVGQNVLGVQDDTGFRFQVELIAKIKESTASKDGQTYYNGSGWVDYRWPTPADKTKFENKTVFAKGIITPDGQNLVVVAGMTIH